MLRGPSFADSLNGDILAVSCEHRPSNPRKLVGQRYGHDVAVCSRKQSLNPPAERRIFLGETRGSRARPVDQQHPPVTVAALADMQQPRFSTRRRLPRHQTIGSLEGMLGRSAARIDVFDCVHSSNHVWTIAEDLWLACTS